MKIAPMTDPLHLDIPTDLQTTRLRLRPFREDDAAALHEALLESIEDLRRHLGFLPWVAEPPTPASALARCRRAQANFLLRTDLSYRVLDRHSGRLLGSVGLHRSDWTLPRTEVGYWVRSSAAGQGIASEAVQGLSDWALSGLGMQRVELNAEEGNAASRGVARRCGFQHEGTLRHTMRAPDGRLVNTCVYARLP